jgi:hypothetical protein
MIPAGGKRILQPVPQPACASAALLLLRPVGAQRGLIDEYRIMVNPVVLGDGKPLFRGIKDRLTLKLTRTETFRNGNVLLYYQPAGKEKYHENSSNT